ncbi:hypothetical protein R6Z07M_000608 [Ovis aries]
MEKEGAEKRVRQGTRPSLIGQFPRAPPRGPDCWRESKQNFPGTSARSRPPRLGPPDGVFHRTAFLSAPPADFRPTAPPPPRLRRAWGCWPPPIIERVWGEWVGPERFERSPAPSELIPGTRLWKESTFHAQVSKLTLSCCLEHGRFRRSREEEDVAVLVTPEKPLRRGLSHRSDPNAVAPTPPGLRLSLGPLSPEKLEEILHEANRLAAQLEQCALQERENTGEGSGPRRVKPSPRRETFVLKDSPVRDLLPTVSSLARSTPSPSSLTPRLRSSDRKGSVRALRATSGKKPSSVKRESPTCNLFPASKSPASSPLARSTPPVRAKAGPSGRVTASPPTPVTPVLAPQPPAGNSQRLSRPQGAAAKPSSRLPVPSAVPRPGNRMPLASRSVPSSKGAPPSDSLSARKGLPRPSAAGHRVPVSQRPNLPISGAGRSNLQPPRKVAVPGPTR